MTKKTQVNGTIVIKFMVILQIVVEVYVCNQLNGISSRQVNEDKKMVKLTVK